MRYVGGKARIATWVAENVLRLAEGRTHYLEPFVGSGAVFAKLAPKFTKSTAADAHPDLILMWQALARVEVFPDWVSREQYAELKKSAPSALRGFVGFGSSFRGKWFGGYDDTHWDTYWKRQTKPALRAAWESVSRDAVAFRSATIICADYKDHVVSPGHVVYCDPPYAETLGYSGTDAFNSSLFWDTARRWAKTGALVVVSESHAPVDWRPYASRTRKAMLRVAKNEENELRAEHLFVWDSENGA